MLALSGKVAEVHFRFRVEVVGLVVVSCRSRLGPLNGTVHTQGVVGSIGTMQ